MGRVKIEIKKIRNQTCRQVTFSKRRSGLIKKAYELCVLSDTDLALLVFSPSGRLISFSGKRRIEDVLIRYLNLPEEEILRYSTANVLENREVLINTLNRLKNEDETTNSEIRETTTKIDEEIITEIKQDINMLQEQLETAEEELRTFERDPLKMTSLEELESFEQQIMKMLACTKERKKLLLKSQASSSSYNPYLEEQKITFENNIVFSWLRDDGQSQVSFLNEFVSSIPESKKKRSKA